MNSDGMVDVQDLILVINNWGSCPMPCPPLCIGDVTGDCVVDVLDLVEVILNFGS